MIKIVIGIVIGLALMYWYNNPSAFDFSALNKKDDTSVSTSTNSVVATSTATTEATTSAPVVKEAPTHEGTDVPKEKSTIMPESIPTIRGPFAIVDTPEYKASGVIEIFEDGGTATLHYEDFETVNGPDLFVYLATDKNAKTFISLGRLKDTKGDFNYDIPNGTDLSKYKYVLVWCRAFDTLFNSALIK